MNDQAPVSTPEILPSRAELTMQAARHWLTACEASIAARDAFHCALAGGGTPRQLYRCLATPWAADRIEWSRVWLYQSDERVVPPEDPLSNWGMIRHELLDRVPLPPDHGHPMIPDAGAAGDPEGAAARYDALLRTRLSQAEDGAPVFDLILLGVGSDGHTASLFPGSPALEERSRYAVTVETTAVPTQRITLTPPVIESAREVIFLVAGEEKAEIVARLFSGGDPDLPVARLRPVGRVRWLLDAAAAAGLSG